MKIDFLSKYEQIQTILSRDSAPRDSAPGVQPSTDKVPEKFQYIFEEQQNVTKTHNKKQLDSQMKSGIHGRLSPEKIPLLGIPPLERETPQGIPKLQVTSVETEKIKTIKTIPNKIKPNSSHHEEKISKIISSQGTSNGIAPSLGIAVASVESSLNPKALSKDGHHTKGLFQLKDSTGKARLAEVSPQKIYNPYDPEQNAELGIRHLKYLHTLFSKDTLINNKAFTVQAADDESLQKLALAAFNAGEGRVAAAQKRALAQGHPAGEYKHIEKFLPKSTQEYVSKVLSLQEELSPLDVG